MRHLLYLLSIISITFCIAANSYAQTYYVRSDGNDRLDGLSDATAWKSLSKVNRFSFKTGDDVYFKCNDNWSGDRLSIKWSGTESNPAVIGSYYIVNRLVEYGVSGNKPIIDGAHIEPASNQWQGLVRVSSQSYVTVRDLKIINSEGEGIEFYNSANAKCLDIDVSNTYQGGIEFWEVENGLISGCTVQESGLVFIENPGNDWPSAIGVHNKSNNVMVKGNKVFKNYGEGIGLYKNSYDNIIELNTCFSNRSANIYIDHGKGMTIRHNVVYGTNDSTYWRSTRIGLGTGRGIVINDEAKYGYAYSENNSIYGNMVANCGTGIVLGSDHVDAVVSNTYVINNTIVECAVGIRHYDGPWENSYVMNNIFQCNNSDCKLYEGNTSTPGLTWKNNTWSAKVPGSLSGDGDIIASVELNKQSGWNNINNDGINSSSFMSKSTSLRNGRDPRLPFEVRLLNCGLSRFSSNEFSLFSTRNYSWPIGADISIIEDFSATSTKMPSPSLRIVFPSN